MEQQLGEAVKEVGGDGDVLVEALSYLHEFEDHTFLIKISGSVLEDEETIESLARDLVLLNENGIRTVVVHGAGDRIDAIMEKAGYEPEFVDGLRVTDEEALELILGAHSMLNRELVWRISKISDEVSAVGLDGVSGSTFVAEKKREELGLVGEITDVNLRVISLLLDDGFMPVISSVGVNEEGDLLNINSDTAAGKLAAAMEADKMITVTDVPGVLEDPEDPDSLISRLTLDEAKELAEEKSISGGMIPKIESCAVALEGGVDRVHLIQGRRHAILWELFTEDGTGTMITR